jgi:hypothetical protein
VRDGEGLLAYAYGSVDAAREDARAIGPPAGLDREVFARLMTLAASLCWRRWPGGSSSRCGNALPPRARLAC